LPTAKIQGPGITGEAIFSEAAQGFVRVNVQVKGDPKVLTPGLHGIHFHAVGSCASGAKPFSEAGGHFDPGPSGSSLPVEANHPYHLGDLPNLVVDKQGKGRLRTITSRVSLLSNDPTSVFDADGTAIIIHKLQDQVKAGGTADEAGGGRLACGVIQKAQGTGVRAEKRERKRWLAVFQDERPLSLDVPPAPGLITSLASRILINHSVAGVPDEILALTLRELLQPVELSGI
jgi:superoxide dismutase, Cu-Zn family